MVDIDDYLTGLKEVNLIFFSTNVFNLFERIAQGDYDFDFNSLIDDCKLMRSVFNFKTINSIVNEDFGTIDEKLRALKKTKHLKKKGYKQFIEHYEELKKITYDSIKNYQFPSFLNF